MALPVSEQIAVVVKTRLGLIKEADGYETTASSVERPTRLGDFHPKDYQLVVVDGDKSVIPALSHPGNPPAQAWLYPFEIRGILRPSEKNTTSLSTLKNTFEADVIKALTSVANWQTFGSLAINAGITAAVPEDSDDGSAGVFMMTLNVVYRISENDPYTVRA